MENLPQQPQQPQQQQQQNMDFDQLLNDLANGNFENNDNNNEDDDDDSDFADLPELLPDIGDDDDDDSEFDDLPELEIIPELVLATYGAIRERVDVEILKSILAAAPAEETCGRPLLRLIKFALRCNREHELQDGILRLLIERDLTCPTIVDDRGGFLLHFACEYAAPVDVVQYLLELHNLAVRVPTEDGQLALHYACSRRTVCMDTISLLLKEFPGAIRCASRDKMLPLHVALSKGVSSEAVNLLLDAHPESAKERAAGDELALHIACRTNMSLDVIQRLVNLYPQSVGIKDGDGGLALHRACSGFNSSIGGAHPLYEPILLVHLLIACDCEECGAPIDVAQFLMEKNPDSACMVDKTGRIPLHYAARNGALELSTKLLKQFPGGILVEDSEGKLPLHLACANGSNQALVRLFIEKHPDALKHKDKSLSIPLHYAAARRMAKTETLELLLEKYKDGIHAVDDQGRLPLHHACETHNLDRIRLLLEVDKYTIVCKTTRSGSSPLRLACLAHRHVEIKRYLLNLQQEALKEIKVAFLQTIVQELGFPDLIQANIWSYVNPNLFEPSPEELQDEDDDSEIESEDSDDDSDSEEESDDEVSVHTNDFLALVLDDESIERD